MRLRATNAAVDDDDIPIEDPEYWRGRAEEARTLSEQMPDSHTKALLLSIAETYERIAKAYDAGVQIAGG
jgi:hypothetical protein